MLGLRASRRKHEHDIADSGELGEPDTSYGAQVVFLRGLLVCLGVRLRGGVRGVDTVGEAKGHQSCQCRFGDTTKANEADRACLVDPVRTELGSAETEGCPSNLRPLKRAP